MLFPRIERFLLIQWYNIEWKVFLEHMVDSIILRFKFNITRKSAFFPILSNCKEIGILFCRLSCACRENYKN